MRHSQTELLDPIIVSTCLDQLRSGMINKITFRLGPEQLLAQDIDRRPARAGQERTR